MIPIWLDPMTRWGEFNKLKESVRIHRDPSIVFGLSESQKSHLVSSLVYPLEGQCLYIAYNDAYAARIYEDLVLFYPDKVVLFPPRENFFYRVEAHSLENAGLRLHVMEQLALGKELIVVASIDALLSSLTPFEIFKENMFTLKVGDEIPLNELSARLVAMGYERVAVVEGKGQFSVRGAIFDVFPLGSENPVRIEFFDEEVDSIRTFDPLSQRSIEKIMEISVSPARELILTEDVALSGKKAIEKSLSALLRKNKGKESWDGDKLKEKIDGILEKLDQGTTDGLESFFPFFYPQAVSLLEYLDPSALIVMDEPARIRDRWESLRFEFEEYFKGLLSQAEVLPEQANVLISYDDFLERLQALGRLALQTLPKSIPDFSPRATFHFITRGIPSYQGKMNMLAEDIAYWRQKKYSVILLIGSRSGGGKGLIKSLEEYQIPAIYRDTAEGEILPGQVIVMPGTLSKGFEYPDVRFALVSDKEIYGVQKRKTQTKKRGKKLDPFTDLKPGDYVVHESHGIGRYLGIEQLVVNGQKRDYLNIQYAGTDKLYIPTDQMDLIQAYIGMDDKPPRLSKLGGSEWKKTKSKVQASIRELAEDLLKLYAARETIKGYPFSPDTEWQRIFEDQFPYEETPDQLQSIEEIKKDMESTKVMDRLLCGDVGYGKTEVAIRAAFKAVVDGKQVAVLAPTTVLAQQHYNPFSRRFADFPFTVQVLSRFKTPAEQKAIIKAVKEGNVDVLIGTHRILGKDVKFKDLGLLIIDEEQRFGVAHKEAIKQLKKNVDVLTLTATPIPRTLHMSLIGIRDISIIETPPEDRRPVQTYVVEYSDSLIRDAILREIQRGGQVYFVYNRVKTMDRMAERLQELVPEARIAKAHGQMSERYLEKVMIDFYDQQYDILLCSTIIESGLDIPNVNTLIVYDADCFGLSQLYQLRGRVGRSNRQAYAYFTYKKDKVLNEMAEKRLQAIKEFTEFGSGFRIAMRDMEIRGTGNLLGPEQHGHMAAVGYDLYCKLLEKTIREMKGEVIHPEQEMETMVDMKLDAYIDGSYIEQESQRIEVYKKIAAIENLQDKYDVEEELEDRFGDLPEPVRNLIDIAYIKALAKGLLITEVVHRDREVKLKLLHEKAVDPKVVSAVLNENRRKLNFTTTHSPGFVIKLQDSSPRAALQETKEIMEKIKHLQTGE